MSRAPSSSNLQQRRRAAPPDEAHAAGQCSTVLRTIPLCSALLLAACADLEDPGDPSMQKILPLGDSITEGVPFSYRYPLSNALSNDGVRFDFVGSHTLGADAYPGGWDMDHEGHSGWMTASIEAELPQWLPHYEVDIALIHLGTNDAGEDNLEGSTAAMTGIVKQLRAHNPSVAICLAQILPFGTELDNDPEFSGLEAFVDDWNARLAVLARDLTTEASPIRLADMHSEFGDAELDDGVHPTEAGAEKMATEWLDCISGL